MVLLKVTWRKEEEDEGDKRAGAGFMSCGWKQGSQSRPRRERDPNEKCEPGLEGGEGVTMGHLEKSLPEYRAAGAKALGKP